jgi:hypothetical protein
MLYVRTLSTVDPGTSFPRGSDAAIGCPLRATKDVDVRVPPDERNMALEALSELPWGLTGELILRGRHR